MKTYKERFIVSKADCISAIDSNLPSVLGTYTIVKWMEIVSAKCINQTLDLNKYITVGEQASIKPKFGIRIIKDLTYALL